MYFSANKLIIVPSKMKSLYQIYGILKAIQLKYVSIYTQSSHCTVNLLKGFIIIIFQRRGVMLKWSGLYKS